MSLEEKREAYQEAYEKAVLNMPDKTQAIIFWTGVNEPKAEEKAIFEKAVEQMVSSVADWVYTFTLFGQSNYYANIAINPDAITQTTLDNIFNNLLGMPSDLKVQYYL